MNFERVSPESVGVPSKAVHDFLDELERIGIEMHSMMLMRHGKVYAQGWWAPYAPDIPHIMFSFSKSLTSTAIGFAEQEGILSLDEKLIDLFPDKVPESPSENLKKANIAHVLMMGCGHETEITGVLGAEDWISQFMEQPFVYEPGTKFLYNTAGTNLLCAILKLKTGQGLAEFLQPRLFEPLGMSDANCYVLPDGTEAGGFGFKLLTEDMARFIQFVANKGSWEGRQLLRAEWFEKATAKQISNAAGDPKQDPDWAAGYGFQFWRCTPEKVFRGDGAFGQFGIVMPDQDACIAITSASMDLQGVLSAVWEKLLPRMQDVPLTEGDDWQSLQYRLANLKLAAMTSTRVWFVESLLNEMLFVPEKELPALSNIVGGTGRFEKEEDKLLSLGFDLSKGESYLLVNQERNSYKLNIGMNGKFITSEVNGSILSANARLRAQNKLEVEIRNMKTASGTRFIFTFEKDKMLLTADSTIPAFGFLADDKKPDMIFTYEKGKELAERIAEQQW